MQLFEEYEQLITDTLTASPPENQTSTTTIPTTVSSEAPTIEPNESITYNFNHHSKIQVLMLLQLHQVLNQLLNLLQYLHLLQLSDDGVSQPPSYEGHSSPTTASTNYNWCKNK